MTRILVTGGTGFVGAALVESLLVDGHVVTVLGRDAGRIRLKFGSRTGVALWASPDDEAWCRLVAGHDVVVNLAGAQAVGTRFTPGSKQRIRDSRVKSTRDLVLALGRAASPPKRLVSASAVGYYGPQDPNRELDESCPSGRGFLAELCHEWETAAASAESFGIGVVLARLGVVIGQGGGAFETMARPFRLGMGGRIGDGKQAVSFISLVDAVQALRRCIEDPSLRGPINLTTPRPVSSSEMAAAMGRVLGKPNWLPVPEVALRLFYGEGAEALLTGQRVIPKILERVGFEWQHPRVEQALASALGATIDPSRGNTSRSSGQAR